MKTLSFLTDPFVSMFYMFKSLFPVKIENFENFTNLAKEKTPPVIEVIVTRKPQGLITQTRSIGKLGKFVYTIQCSFRDENNILHIFKITLFSEFGSETGLGDKEQRNSNANKALVHGVFIKKRLKKELPEFHITMPTPLFVPEIDEEKLFSDAKDLGMDIEKVEQEINAQL